jgi:uncharacterized protein
MSDTRPTLTRRALMAKLALGAAILTWAPLALVNWYQRIRVEHVTIPPDADQDAPRIRLAQLSDLHVADRSDVRRLSRAVEMTNALQPDAVVLTGDYIWRAAEHMDLVTPHLARLEAPLGVYAVLGNHDLWISRDKVTQGLQEAGARVLNNEGLVLEQGAASIYLAGLDDGWSGQPDLEQALADHDGERPVVLLFHEPDLGHDLVAQGRVWLQLSGHTHGGQVRLPRLGAVILPEFGRQYEQGLYRVGPGWIYVNRGLGTTMAPVRFQAPPEITLLDIYPTRQGAKAT